MKTQIAKHMRVGGEAEEEGVRWRTPLTGDLIHTSEPYNQP